jgi:predicted HAD superfamily hydrolase
VQIVKSFGVFETLVAKPFAPPHELFPLVAIIAKRNHYLSIDPSIFAARRVLAERRARKRADHHEVTIEDIYAESRSILKLSKEDVAVLISCEIKLETELCRPIRAGLALLESARHEDARVVFISDTYLSSCAVRSILVRNGCWKEGDRLYVSCEVGATKRNGHLFRHVLESESIVAGQMIHVGSDPRSDVEVPRRFGIGIEPFIQGNFNARENHLGTAKGFGPLMPPLLAGCSRLVRLGATETTAQHQRVREIAAHTAGPLLSGFVLWVLQTAKAERLRRLYFISRDGFILLKVAKELAASVDPTIELRYLYGSRQAWHFPASRGIGLEQDPWVWEWTTSYAVATVLGRVGLVAEAVASLLESEGIPPEAWNEPMTYENEVKLKRVFLNPQFQKILMREAEQQRVWLIAYLKQEGLFSDIERAIVDVGWKATLQDALGAILEQEGHPPVRGFYVGLCNGGTRPEKGERRAYLFDLRHGRKWKLRIPQAPSCVEAFCAANHGSTLGYRVERSSIVPVLQPWRTRPFETWGLEVLQTAATEFAAELGRVLPWVGNGNIHQLLAARSLALTWSKPTLEEAECLGSFPFTEELVGIGAKPLAHPLPWQHFARIVKAKYSKSYQVSWIEGCLRLTPEPRSSFLRLANIIKNVGIWALTWKTRSLCTVSTEKEHDNCASKA